MRIIIFTILLCLAATPANADPIKIGAIVSLTGPAAEQGRNWLQGAELAQAKLMQDGIQVDLKIEDDGTRPAGVASAFSKLATQDQVRGILGGTWDFLAEAAAPLARRYGIPFVTPTNPVEVFSPEAKEVLNFFTVGLSIRATEEAIRKVLPKSNDLSVYVVVPNVPFGSLHAEIFERLAASSKIRIVGKTIFDFAGYHDTLKAAAIKIASQNPSVVFCVTDYTGLNVFMTELNRRRYAGRILTTQHLDEAVRLSHNPARFERVVGFYPKVVDQDFQRAFRAKFGHDPKVYAAEGHDALISLARAIAGAIDLRHHAFETSGVTGKIKFEPGRTEIVRLEAIPLVVGASGELEPLGDGIKTAS